MRSVRVALIPDPLLPARAADAALGERVGVVRIEPEVVAGDRRVKRARGADDQSDRGGLEY